MVDIKTIALLLLMGRAVSLFFIIRVLILQAKLFGTTINFDLVPNLTGLQKEKVYRIRRVLFILSFIIFITNIIPVVVDTLTLFIDTNRPPTLGAISIAYAFNNSIGAAVSAVMIWFLYRIAGFGVEKP